jgi:hypothetical protein
MSTKFNLFSLCTVYYSLHTLYIVVRILVHQVVRISVHFLQLRAEVGIVPAGSNG